MVAVERGQVVGTCRLVIRGGVVRLGRLAVTRGRRGRGVGRAVLEEAERAARATGAERLSLHAQAHAKALYARAGYAERGEPFHEEGIEHVRMDKRLA